MSEQIVISLPGGTQASFDKGISALDVAGSISEGLKRNAVAAMLDGKVVDLSTTLEKDGELRILTFNDDAGVDVFRHSSAHVMAQAVVSLFPDAKPTIGPVVDEGFYYDFDHQPFTPEDIEKIDAKMQEIVKAKHSFHRQVLSKKEALDIFKDNPFKIEIINELPEDATISAYRQGDFLDLCRGPHAQHTGQIKAIKILKVAGAYWRGDPHREQLQRIYGISYPDKKSLDLHMQRLEEAKKRDHRRIGKSLDLFSFHDEGPGFVFWHNKGVIVRNEMIEFWRKLHKENNYNEIITPVILNEELWHRSGHWDNYKNNMYFTKIDDLDYAIKPMNCPGGLLIFNYKRHSYRDFPLKAAELGLVHRHELSGVLHGLFRVRMFTQDDAHIFCTPEQLEDEIMGVINLTNQIYSTFGFQDVHVELSTRPVKSIGSDEMWQNAEGALSNALKRKGIDYQLNPGDGAFYGPKIDFHIRDCMGRSWQCGTIQVDFSMPQRFEAYYEGPDGQKHNPVMVHRAIFGSLERFLGVLIEHYAGKFPLWMAPVQVKVLSLSERFEDYAREVTKMLTAKGIRAETDDRNETLNKKVREAQLEQVCYQAIVGEREQESRSVSVRARTNKQLGSMTIDEFTAFIKEKIETRWVDPDEAPQPMGDFRLAKSRRDLTEASEEDYAY